MGPERLDRAKTVEAIAADTAPGRPPWAGAGLVRYPPRGVGLTPDAAVGLLGASVDGHGGLIFPTVDAVGGRSLGARRRNHPRVASIGIVSGPAWTDLQRCLPRAGRIQLVERGADPAAGKQPRHGSRHRGRDPELAAVGRGSEHASGESVEPPRRPSASPMIAGHAAGQKLHRDYSDRPAGQRKLFSCSRPRRPKGSGLILSPARQVLAGAARLLCNVHACGPAQDRRPGLPRLRF